MRKKKFTQVWPSRCLFVLAFIVASVWYLDSSALRSELAKQRLVNERLQTRFEKNKLFLVTLEPLSRRVSSLNEGVLDYFSVATILRCFNFEEKLGGESWLRYAGLFCRKLDCTGVAAFREQVGDVGLDSTFLFQKDSSEKRLFEEFFKKCKEQKYP